MKVNNSEIYHCKPIETVVKELSRVKDWFIEGGAVVPHLLYITKVFSKEIKKIYPDLGTPFIIVFYEDRGDKSTWCVDKQASIKTADKIIQQNLFDKLYVDWQKVNAELHTFISSLDIKKIDIVKDYQVLWEKHLKFYTYGMHLDHFIEWSDREIEILRKKYPALNLQELIKPSRQTFLAEEELDLLKIAKKIEKNKINSFENLKNTECYTLLSEHQKKYFWIENNYKYTPQITIEEFFRRAKELVNEDIDSRIKDIENYENSYKKSCQKIFGETKVSPEDKKIIEIMSFSSWWQDGRKATTLLVNYWINSFLEKASKKYNIDFEKLQYIHPDEFQKMLISKNFNLPEVKDTVIVWDSNGDFARYYDKDFLKIKEIVLVKPDPKTMKEVKGSPAFGGNIRGNVRIIYNPKSDFKKGDVLVTTMTRPEFVPLMKRASAVITDEGGITSHAAIIARELKIPCIVGTKFATHFLKDGDLVEVDADKGIVKIIKNNNK